MKDGKFVLVVGSPGGRTIINTVLNILVSVLDYDLPLEEAVAGPRLHHQWFPDVLRFEGMTKYAETVKALQMMGHRVEGHRQGDAHCIRVDPRSGAYVGVADKRLSGYAAGY